MTRQVEVAELRSHDGSRFVAVRTTGGQIASAWAGPGSAIGWVEPSRRVPGRAHAVALGPAQDAAELVRRLAEDTRLDVRSATLPRDADEFLAPVWVLDRRNDWEWFVTSTRPPAQVGEESVDWLTEDDVPQLQHVLDTWSPRHDVDADDPSVVRWAGVKDGADLLAVAAHTAHGGTPDLKSVVTCGPARRRGLGAAVTAWVTRALLAEGHPEVTLGMYSDNDVARRLYLRLGYRVEQELTSGRLVRVP